MSDYVKFTEDMIKTHTILVPDMLPVHFRLLISIFEAKGYKLELRENDTELWLIKNPSALLIVVK